MKFSTTILKDLRETFTNRYEPERLHALAAMYWYLILSITGVVILSSLCYGLWQLVSLVGTREQGESSLVPKGRAPALKREALEMTTGDFKDRQARYNILKNNPPRLPDPSR